MKRPGEGEAQRRLEALEAVIEHGLQTFVEVGSAIREIRDSRLYRERYATFEDYCHERWGWGRNYANKQVVAADTAALVGTNVPIANEAQARALAPLAREDPEAAREVWAEAVGEAEREGRKPTAAAVRERVAAAARERSEAADPRPGVIGPVPGTTPETPYQEGQRRAAERKGQRLAQRAEYALRTGNTELPADPEIAAAWEYALWEAVSLRGQNIPNVVDALGHQLHILVRHAPPEDVGRYLASPVDGHPLAEHRDDVIEELRQGVAWIGRVIEEAELTRGPESANDPRRPVWIGPTEDHGRDYVARLGEIVGKSFEAYGFGPGRRWRWTVRLDDGEQIEVRPWEIRFL